MHLPLFEQALTPTPAPAVGYPGAVFCGGIHQLSSCYLKWCQQFAVSRVWNNWHYDSAGPGSSGRVPHWFWLSWWGFWMAGLETQPEFVMARIGVL